MMSSSPNISSPVTKWHWLRNWLVILVVGVLIFVLPGGFPPAAWVLLIQMASKWSLIMAVQGNAIFIPFAILLLQAILLLVAWIMLIMVAIREISLFKDAQTQARIAVVQASLVGAGNAGGAMGAAGAVDVMDSMDLAAEVASLPQAQRSPWYDHVEDDLQAAGLPKSRGVRVDENDLLSNPFEQESDNPFGQEPGAEKSRGLQISSVPLEEEEEEEEDDSFDVGPAPFNLSLNVADFEDEDQEVTTALERKDQKEDEQTPIFMFGDPLAGDLPDVFDYDLDLKRSVENKQMKQQAVREKEKEKEKEKENQDFQDYLDS